MSKLWIDINPNLTWTGNSELDFGVAPQKLQEEYMDIYEGIHSAIVSSNRFDENSDISTMYLGKIENGGTKKN